MPVAGSVLSLPHLGRAEVQKTRFSQKSAADSASDVELVRRAQKGDEEAFRKLVEKYQSRVLSIIYGILRNRNDAEDIAQQVFAKVYQALKSFDFRSSFLTWLYKITVNECYDYLRKKRVRKLVYESDLPVDEESGNVPQWENRESEEQAPVPIDEAVAQRDFINKLLAKLPEEDRMLLLLKEVEGYSIEDLAQLTGLNENTVKVKLFRARQKLLKLAEKMEKSFQQSRSITREEQFGETGTEDSTSKGAEGSLTSFPSKSNTVKT